MEYPQQEDHFEINPWNVDEGLEHFLYYCCPECDMKSNSRELFLQHALNFHPMVEKCLQALTGVVKILRDTTSENKDLLKFPKDPPGNSIQDQEEDSKVQNDEDKNDDDFDLENSIDAVAIKPHFLDPEQIIKVEQLGNAGENERIIFAPIKKKRQKCQICQQWSKNLDRHTCKPNSIEKEGDYKCALCGKTFRYQSKYFRHQNEVIHEKRKCNLCPDHSFVTKHQLIAHTRQNHPENFLKKKKYIKCQLCQKWSRELEEHNCSTTTDQNSTTVFPCPHCEKVFQAQSTCSKHINEIHSNPKCNLCEKSFISQRKLMEHYAEVHEGQKASFPCSSCDKSFGNSHLLRQHMRKSKIHQKIEHAHKCNSCDKVYNQKHSLISHIKIVHEGQQKISCESCGKQFTNAATLKNHTIILHTGGQIWQCDKCDKSFRYRPTFLSHVAKEHEGGLPYKCDICGKAFLKDEKAQIHKKTIHEGLYDHMCDLCGKGCADIYKLKRHLNEVHVLEGYQFDCKQCPQKFKDKYRLHEHIKSFHEGVKFKCESCGKEFNRKQVMRIHFKYVHGGKRNFPCQMCPHKANRKQDLKKHIKSIHKEDHDANHIES